MPQSIQYEAIVESLSFGLSLKDFYFCITIKEEILVQGEGT